MKNASIQVGLELRSLTCVEGQFIGVVKELTAELHELLSTMGPSKEQEQAMVRLEEAAMWATKHIAIHGHANEPA